MNGLLPSIKDQLEQYILNTKELEIHRFDRGFQLCDRQIDYRSLYTSNISALSSTLKVRRNVDTGEVIDFTEVEIENSTTNKHPGVNSRYNRKSLTSSGSSKKKQLQLENDPFDELDASLDFSIELNRIAPGFDYGLRLDSETPTDASGHYPKYFVSDATKILLNDSANENLKSIKNGKIADLLSIVENENESSSSSSELQRIGEESHQPNKGQTSDDSGIDPEDESVILPEDSISILKISEPVEETEKKIIENWAENVPLLQDLTLFEKNIPDPAHQYDFVLDPFQKQAIMKLEEHKNIFVAAHTSAGKTVVAEYAIALSIKHLTKTIYTSPIKALSNQKYRDFKKSFRDVGLITGDIKVNENASCLIMTTEILRSMLYRGSSVTNDLEYVIFDEVHYINDSERGHVWEEVLVLLPNHVCIIMLSATVPNAMELANWLGNIKKRKVYVISTRRRPVPLKHYVYTNLNSKSELNLIMNENREFLHSEYTKVSELFKWAQKKEKRMGANSAAGGSSSAGGGGGGGGGGGYGRQNPKDEKRFFLCLLDFLDTNKKLPAVIFIFSRAKCDNFAQLVSSCDLTSSSEKFMINKFFEKSVKTLKDEDQRLPQVLRMKNLLIKGIGVHHSGILPILKEIVEICFQNGWIKVLFATETFAMGVNMPARTVLFYSITKFDGLSTRFLKPAEYIQMAGRAGRRGLDDVGTVIILLKAKPPEATDLKLIMTKDAESLKSQFRITYRMLLNVLRVERLNLEEIISHSFRENFNLIDQDKRKNEIEKTQQILNKSSHSVRGNNQLYDVCRLAFQVYDEHAAFMQKLAPFIRKHMCCGRIIIVGHKVAVKFALLLDTVITRNTYSYVCLVLNDPETKMEIEETIERIADDLSVELKLYRLARFVRDRIDNLPCFSRFKFIQIDASDVFEITTTCLKLNFGAIYRDFRTQNARASNETIDAIKILGELTRERLKSSGAKSGGVSALASNTNPIRDFKIKDLELVEAYLKLVDLRNGYRSILRTLEFSDSEFCSILDRVIYEQKLHSLQEQQLQTSNVTYLESDLKKKVLRAFDYVNNQDRLTLKGRVACQLSTNELIITELVLQGILVKLYPEEVAAILSALVFEAKTENIHKDYFTPNIKEALDLMSEILFKIQKQEIENGINDEMFNKSNEVNLGLVFVVYRWAQNCPFSEIMRLTDVQEGLIVRCIQQLHEMLQDVRDAAKLIGDSILQAKMEEASILIKRDIVFAISLYTQ